VPGVLAVLIKTSMPPSKVSKPNAVKHGTIKKAMFVTISPMVFTAMVIDPPRLLRQPLTHHPQQQPIRVGVPEYPIGISK
jgi:hypothetical protein